MTGHRPRPGWRRRGQWVGNSVVYGSLVQVKDVDGDVDIRVNNERALYQVDALPSQVPRLSVRRARDQPARLLQARFEIVDFIGRAVELSRLAAWRDRDEGVSGLLLHGGGGQGKTRLAAHFARASRSLGWNVLQARHATDPGPAVGQGSGPTGAADDSSAVPGTLMLVDYAERWPTDDLLELCADALRQSHPVRLLLISRPAGVWWQTLAGNELERLEIDTDRIELGSLADEDGISPRALFAAARDRFAVALDIAGADAVLAPPAIGSDHEFAQALAVQMLALAAVDSHQRNLPDRHGWDLSTVAEVSAYLLRRERGHWDRLHRRGRIQISADALSQAAYTAALTGPQPYALSKDALGRIEISTQEPIDRILKDHAVSYPPATGSKEDGGVFLEPLYPDRLAEDFVALMLPGHSMPSAFTPDPWVADAPERLLIDQEVAITPSLWGRSALNVLIASAARWPHMIERQLAPLFDTHPGLAAQAGGAGLAALAELPELHPSILEKVLAHLPETSDADLDPGSAAIAHRVAEYQLSLTEDPAIRARTRDHLAMRLLHSGQAGEALRVGQEALATWRALAAEYPGMYDHDLAGTLVNVGAALSGVDRGDDALALAREGAGIYRRLTAQDPRRRADFAGSLVNLGGALFDVGRPTEALGPMREAVRTYRVLAAADPIPYQSGLATALNNLSTCLARLRDNQSALDAASEAAEIYRTLASTRPTADRPGLAGALTNVARHLAAMGQPDEARRVAHEAVGILEELVTVNPAGHLSSLAGALLTLSNTCEAGAESAEALQSAHEAVEIYRALAATRPAEHQSGLANALCTMGKLLARTGQGEQALALLNEAMELFRRLAATNASGHRIDLADAVIELGTCLRALGQQGKALECVAEGVEIYRGLAVYSPADYLPRLAAALGLHGTRLLGAGQRESALDATSESVGIFRQLAEADALANEPGLADNLYNQGVILAQGGDHEQAEPPAREAVEILRRLAAADPDHLPDLAAALSNLGVALAGLGQNEPAYAATREAVAILQQRTTTDPTAHLPELASALNNLVGRLAAVGQLEQALTAARESVDAYRRLATADPPTHRLELAAALTNLSGALSDLGQFDQSLSAANEAVRICRSLASGQPSAYQHILASALNNSRSAVDGLRRQAAAEVDTWRQRAAEDHGRLPSLGVALGQLADLLAVTGERQQALATASEAIEILRALAAAEPATYEIALADRLYNHSGNLIDLGQYEQARCPAQEAAGIFRRHAATDPGRRRDLGDALNNLGYALAQTGEDRQALDATREAVELFRDLDAAGRAAHLPDIANTLTNLVAQLYAAGDFEHAVRPAQEAIEIYRTLVAAAPDTYQHALAGALNNLGAMLIASGQYEQALEPAQEAVEIYGRLPSSDQAAHHAGITSAREVLRVARAGVKQTTQAQQAPTAAGGETQT